MTLPGHPKRARPDAPHEPDQPPDRATPHPDGSPRARQPAVWLFTAEPLRRARLLQIFVALLAQAGGIVVMAGMVWNGWADPRWTAIWAPASMALSAAVFLAVRRGWTDHLPDPALTQAQIAYSIGSTVVCYALLGPMRAVAWPMACLALIFSIFALTPAQLRRLTYFMLALYALVMASLSWHDPAVFRPRDEVMLWLILAVSVLPLSLLAARLSQLRARLGRQKAELEEALARIGELASRDELTGLANRRHMTELLARQALASQRTGRGFAVAIADLDHFKRVNDEHGHAAGDVVLRTFADAARDALRGSDTIGRWGGEEFLVLFPDSSESAAAQAASRLRERVEALDVPLPDGPTLRFTVSVGLTAHRSGESVDTLIERADRAMYQAKAQGRNRVVTIDAGMPGD